MVSRETRKRWSYVLSVTALTMLLAIVMLGGNSGPASAAAPTNTGTGTGTGITAAQASKISPVVLQDTAAGKSTSVMVVLADQANVDAANSMTNQDARGWYVYNTLIQHAQRTQASLRASLDAQGVTYTSFWAVNALVVTADRPLVEILASRSDVGTIESNKPQRWIEDPKVANAQPANNTPDTAEWGVMNVNAPQVWAMGFTGQGIVIGNQDTGMRWTHAALKPQYRGWDGTTADHNYNWHDSIHSGGGACGPDSIQPCDDQGHGTHTTGTTAGDDGTGNQVGVAPGAKWIGCRNMNVGAGTPASYTECFQFFIAPTDLNNQNPNPALRPHVINNSWGCPISEGCTSGAELETIVNNTQAAGIFVEASAGNDGPGCSTVSNGTNGGPPAIYEASFTTGAYDINNNLASFSSRGPSLFYNPNLMKPNISAPGVNVRSSTRTSDTSYGNLSGTSMAGPHVVGVVALLWSARPQLVRDIATTKTILQNTANPNVVLNPVQTCGGIPSSQVPNNSFGYGRVDVLAAVNSVVQGTPTATPTAIATIAEATATSSPTSVATAVATATACTISFTDVPSDSTFYTFIRCLACRGIISGYDDGTFRPNNEITRGQIAKMVSNAAGFQDDPGPQIYEDVDSTNTFYTWINRLSNLGFMGGYPCGTIDPEPCNPPENRPYFRPFANATRGQLAKIVANAAGLSGTPTGVFYTDVQEDNAFYTWIMRLTDLGAMSGYNCGGPNEPCDSENRPYFRPFANVTRGQASKIVANTFLPDCQTPGRP